MPSINHTPATSAAERLTCDALLALYQPCDAFFASPAGVLLGQGVAYGIKKKAKSPTSHAAAGHVLRGQVRELLHRAQERLGAQGSVVMGAIPFDLRRPARLIVPKALYRGQAPQSGGLRAAPLAATVEKSTPMPATAVYEAAVADALAHLQRGELDKVVLARALDLRFGQTPDMRALVACLVHRNLDGYTFAIAQQGGGHMENEPAVFVGATPELLVRRLGERVIVNPLAGSAARRSIPSEDMHAGERLLASTKDLREHAVVIDAVVQALRPLCRTLDVPAGPSLLATDALWHLSTVLTGEVAASGTTSLDLALALHPTPAVCGQPLDRALAVIEALESVDRGLFSGFVGWCDTRGDGEWAVSLRCAQLCGRSMRLHAGAGIVLGSDPRSESRETGTKFRTMLSALGLATSVD